MQGVPAHAWGLELDEESVFHGISIICEAGMHFRCDSSRIVGGRKFFQMKMPHAQNNTFLFLAV